MKRLIREPLLWFLLAGLLVFAVDRYRSGADGDSDVITVDAALREAIFTQQASLLGRPLTDSEKAQVIAKFVDEEVLVREAIRRGIDRNDGRIRQILLEKMSFLLGESPQPPDDEALQQWFEANRERYRMPEIRDFEHIYFEDASRIPDEQLSSLESGQTGGELGDRFWLGTRLEGYARPELESVLGTGFADSVFEAEAGEWFGPVESARGVHFVRVTSVRASRLPSFESIQPVLTDEWIAEQAAIQRARRLESLRSGYRVILEPGSERAEAGR